MNPTKVLSATLVAQAALAAFTWWPSSQAAVAARELVPGGGNSITAIEITGAGGKPPVKLESADGHWKLTSAQGFPADDAKVGEVVEALAKIKLAQPIASQASSYEALKVDDAGFDKKVTVTTASGPVSFLVGSAESKAIHVRLVDSPDVYQVKGLSAWTIKDDAKGYLPANYLEVEKDKITSLSITNGLGALQLEKGEAGWTIGGAAPGPAAQAEVDKLLDAATKVRLAEVVGPVVTPEQGLQEPAARVTWTTKEGDSSSMGGLVVGAESGSNRFVKSDGSAFVALAPSQKLKELIEATPGKLVGSAPASAGDAPPDLPPGMEGMFAPE